MRARWAVAVGLVATGVLTADVVTVVDLRAEQRADAAARAAAAAYREQVAEALPAVHAARVPLLDAYAMFDRDRSRAADVYYDVRVHGAVSADIADAHAALSGVTPPAPLAPVHEELLAELERMRAAAEGLSSTDEGADLGFHLTGFRQAGRSFDSTVSRRLGLPADLPRTEDLPADRLTRAGLLYRWSGICSTVLSDHLELPEPADGDLQAVADLTDREAALLERALTEVAATEVPSASGAELEREVRAPLRALAPAPKALRDLAAALRNRDPAGIAGALLALDELSPSFEQVADAMQRQGSSTCTLLFDGGLVDGDSGEPSDDTTQT